MNDFELCDAFALLYYINGCFASTIMNCDEKVMITNLRENKREVGQANEDQVSSVPGEEGVQDISNALGKSKDCTSKIRLFDVLLVGLCEQSGVHLQKFGLASQASHSADVGDRFNSKLKQNCHLN